MVVVVKGEREEGVVVVVEEGVGIVEGLQNPRGLGLGCVGVGVRVGISVPRQNPYPQQGFRGMYRDKNICKYHIYSPKKSISSANIYFLA